VTARSDNHAAAEPAAIVVVRGRPTDEELAAVLAVLHAVARRAATQPQPGHRAAHPAWTRRNSVLAPGSWLAAGARRSRTPIVDPPRTPTGWVGRRRRVGRRHSAR
jgi:hypothetical protein